MSFKDEIYPHRTNRIKFVGTLIDHVDRDWKKMTTVGHSYVLPGFVKRNNKAPVNIDRQRVKALLHAWARKVPDRYLDLASVRSFAYRKFRNQDALLVVMKKNASLGGAVRFIRNELESSGTGQRCSTVFFGPKLFANWSYDTYYSYLLNWDDNYCYGLIRALQMKSFTAVLGGGSSTSNAWRAAKDWIVQNKRNGVYKFYNIMLN
jgi:hypothetical protein